MTELTRIVALLQEQRRALQDQLDAVDRAIAALDGAGPAVGEADAPDDLPAGDVPRAIQTRQVKARRTQTDAHKHAIAMGKRKARHAREAAKGLAREAHDEGFVPAIGVRGGAEAPRLVKRKT
ncbi:MAG: hypothetical protein HY824_11250 [Acidobacteria bacterium]|nr:hypothetical protein [Acidobacteriota bacterium]